MHPVISAVVLFAISIGLSLFILNYSSHYFAQAEENLAWEKGIYIAQKIVSIANELKNFPEGTIRRYSFYLPGGTISINNRSIIFRYGDSERILHTQINLTSILLSKGKHTIVFKKKEKEIFVYEE